MVWTWLEFSFAAASPPGGVVICGPPSSVCDTRVNAEHGETRADADGDHEKLTSNPGIILSVVLESEL